jgi:hypothetical protein
MSFNQGNFYQICVGGDGYNEYKEAKYDNYHGNDGAPLAMLTRMFFGPIIAIIFAVLIYQIRGI